MSDILPPDFSAGIDMYSSRRQNDIDLYRKWKADPSKENMSELVKALMPLINTEVNRASGTLSTSVLRAEGIKWAIEAIKRFDESKGVQLSTHVTNYLQKVRRLNYKHQNAARLPEALQLQFGTFNTAKNDLMAELDRTPTDSEMAERLGWKPVQVRKFQDRLYEDLYESSSLTNTAVTSFATESALIDLARQSLTEEERIVFDNKMIADKNKQLNNTQLAAKLGVNQNRLQYITRRVIEKTKALKRDIGHWG